MSRFTMTNTPTSCCWKVGKPFSRLLRSRKADDTDLDDCVHKINKKMGLKNRFDISLVLTRNGKDILPIRNGG